MAQMVKESACPAGDPGSVPQLGREKEKGVATHSSVLTWRIPRTEEPGRLQSMGSQRVKHDSVKHLTLYSYSLLSLLI